MKYLVKVITFYRSSLVLEQCFGHDRPTSTSLNLGPFNRSPTVRGPDYRTLSLPRVVEDEVESQVAMF